MTNDLSILAQVPNLDMVQSAELVGSRITCNPPPLDTDQDVLILLKDRTALCEYIGACISLGCDFDGSVIEDKGNSNFSFASVTRCWNEVDINFIITKSEKFYKKFCLASYVAKSLNLLNKNDRILLFQAILYGNQWKPEVPIPSSLEGV